ncbi:MAG: purine nucleoside phosphorylase inosine and guanosine-specific [Bacteriovoracaceae bacterium]|nr:purine nucleoside phosphorylase inosine and guanosine-specific [Bacteriovoracaceae bacterium]
MGSSLEEAKAYLEREFGKAPKIAVVLGSGLSPFAKTLRESKKVSTASIPSSVKSTVVGHFGELVYGKSGSTSVIVLAGRVHGFEGHSPTQVVHNLRALRLWGVKKFIITNAAGSTSRKHKPGSLVLIRDHINFTGLNPLTGLELFGGPRFPDVSDAYSSKWRKQVLQIAKKLKFKMSEGVYAAVNGPNYETAAEIRMFFKLGADLVGMSTVWEVLALIQMGAEILGISCVTNFATGVTKEALSHHEVIETTKSVQKKFNLLLEKILQASN